MAFGNRTAETVQDGTLPAISCIQIIHFNHILLYCLPVGRYDRCAQFPLSRSVRRQWRSIVLYYINNTVQKYEKFNCFQIYCSKIY